MIYLAFATCPRGHRTPLQPSNSATEAINQKWIETGGELPYVACESCKRVYKPAELEIGPGNGGLSPYHKEARLHVFRVPIECDDAAHEFQLEVIAVRNADTIGESLREEMALWKWEILLCPHGHETYFSSDWYSR